MHNQCENSTKQTRPEGMCKRLNDIKSKEQNTRTQKKHSKENTEQLTFMTSEDSVDETRRCQMEVLCGTKCSSMMDCKISRFADTSFDVSIAVAEWLKADEAAIDAWRTDGDDF